MAVLDHFQVGTSWSRFISRLVLVLIELQFSYVFKRSSIISIQRLAKRLADAFPPLNVERVHQGVDYGKKGVDFYDRLPPLPSAGQ